MPSREKWLPGCLLACPFSCPSPPPSPCPCPCRPLTLGKAGFCRYVGYKVTSEFNRLLTRHLARNGATPRRNGRVTCHTQCRRIRYTQVICWEWLTTNAPVESNNCRRCNIAVEPSTSPRTTLRSPAPKPATSIPAAFQRHPGDGLPPPPAPCAQS